MKHLIHSESPRQLEFFAMFDAVDEVIAVATAPSRAQERALMPHPAGSYLIRSEREQAFWSNAQGWVADSRFATAFTPEHVCGAHITQWRRDGKPIVGAKGHWHWIGKGGLAGYRYADWDGPFPTEDAARAASLEMIGPSRPLMTSSDAGFVLASQAQAL